MKRLFAIVAIAAALFTSKIASAKPIATNSEVISYCAVNGVTYPIDGGFNVWGRNAFGYWVIIGHLFATPNGWEVVSGGVTYGAACY
jgi:hypothetical protein